MTLLSSIILPFQAGYENIITASAKPKELSVIKRTFEDNCYKYTLQSDSSLFSWQGRMSMFIKGITLCLPFIGHITSIALRRFSFPIFPEMPLDFAVKCSLKQKLEIAKWIYTNKPEGVNEATRLALAKILADDEEGLSLVINNIDQIGPIRDIELIRKIISKGIEPTQKIIEQNPEVLKQIKSHFAKQILQQDPTDHKFITTLLDSLSLNENLTKTVIKELILQTKKVKISHQMQAAIIHVLKNCADDSFIEQLLKDNDSNIALADILLSNEEGCNLVIANIVHINLLQNMAFSQKLFQKNPIPEQIKQHFAKQILQQDPIDHKFIIHLFDKLLNEPSQAEVIRELLRKMRSYTPSDQMQAAIAHTIIKKYPIGPNFLLSNISQFNHTQELADILVEMLAGKTYIANNIDKFNLLEEEKNSLLQKCITTVLV